MRRRQLFAFVALPALGALAAVTLGGCSALPKPPGERVHSGRFSLTTLNGGQRDNLAGRFTLALAPRTLTLDLSNPLGTTLARLQAGADGAVLTVPSTGPASNNVDRPDDTRRPRELRGPDADALTLDVLGFALPVSGISDWIEGRPAPGRPAQIERATDTQRIETIIQDGWTIRVLERFDNSSSPRRLQFERAAMPAGNTGSSLPAPAITLRLVLDAPAATEARAAATVPEVR